MKYAINWDLESIFAGGSSSESLQQELQQISTKMKEFHQLVDAFTPNAENQVEALSENYPNVYPVNYNGPGQLVVAGKKEELDCFAKDVKEAGGRCLPVAVGGGFHSPFMDQASVEFSQAVEQVSVQKPSMTVYSNFTTKPYTEDVKNLMVQQINHSLRWQESIENMAADGFDTFIEVGVGTTLKKLISRILPDSKTYAVSNMEEARHVAEEVKGTC